MKAYMCVCVLPRVPVTVPGHSYLLFLLLLVYHLVINDQSVFCPSKCCDSTHNAFSKGEEMESCPLPVLVRVWRAP
jgi:hypothetical protein